MKLGISIRGYEVNVGRYNIKFIIELNKIKVWMCVCLCLCLFVCLFVVVVVVCSCFFFFFCTQPKFAYSVSTMETSEQRMCVIFSNLIKNTRTTSLSSF